MMKQTLTLRARLTQAGDIRPVRPLDLDKMRQNRITRQLSRVNAILARRALTTH